MIPKPHRPIAGRLSAYAGRLSGYAGEAAAYLRRRRLDREPFARVYTGPGAGAAHPPDSPAGRDLFAAAERLVALAAEETEGP